MMLTADEVNPEVVKDTKVFHFGTLSMTHEGVREATKKAVETAKANGLSPMKYIKYILSDMPGSAFLEFPEYLDDYLPWNPYVKEICK